VTDDSAFKKQVRARMAETGEKYTVARRTVLAGRDPGRPPMVLRVYVDLELTAEAGRAYAAADEQGRREMAGRLLAEQSEAQVGSAIVPHEQSRTEAQVGSAIVPHEQSRTEAEDAAVRDAVRRGVDRVVGVSAVEVSRVAGQLRVTIRAARPILLAGQRGAEADRLRGELEELTGTRVRLEIRELSGSPD
jgi:hypothetical protein